MAMQEAPALANERVMDLPIPFEAPQMKTFLPARQISESVLLIQGENSKLQDKSSAYKDPEAAHLYRFAYLIK